MFTKLDKIVVGLSGGKDSLVLLRSILNFRSRFPDSPKTEAILIDEGISGYRQESMQIAKEICKKWAVPLHIESFKNVFGRTLDEVCGLIQEDKINACTVCGTVRRRLLNQTAKSLNADCIAIGHNLDDQAETFMQNIMRNDLKQILLHIPHANPPDQNHAYVRRIRPLIQIPEAEITLYCYFAGIPIQTNDCPYSERFFILRKEVQSFLNRVDQNSPEIKYNLLAINQKIIENFSNMQINENYAQDVTYPTLCERCSEFKGLKRKICYYCELKEKYGT